MVVILLDGLVSVGPTHGRPEGRFDLGLLGGGVSLGEALLATCVFAI